MVAWPSGLRRWFKAPVSSEAWVQIPLLPNFFTGGRNKTLLVPSINTDNIRMTKILLYLVVDVIGSSIEHAISLVCWFLF